MSAFLDTAAAAIRVGLARQTLAKMRVVGGGPAYVKIGAKVFYPASELERWVNAHPLRRSTSDRPVSPVSASE